MSVQVLLVDAEADRLSPSLAGADVTPVASAEAARAYLAGTRFDAVAVRAGTPGHEALDAVAERLGMARLTYGDAEAADLEGFLAPRLGLALRPASVAAGTEAPGPVALADGWREELRALQHEFGQVAHDLANPLAVVVGNAQLGAEMAHAFGADEALLQAFDDIEAAGNELSERIGRLAALRARLEALANGAGPAV